MADVSFTKKTWADGSSGGTPITASELNRMEQGIKDCATACNELGDSISLKILTKEVSYSLPGNGSVDVTIPFEIPDGCSLVSIIGFRSNSRSAMIVGVWSEGFDVIVRLINSSSSTVSQNAWAKVAYWG